MKKIKEFLREILAPRVVIHQYGQYGNLSQKDMDKVNRAFKKMDEAFNKMDEAFREMF